MKKTAIQLQAEQTVATILRNSTLEKARHIVGRMSTLWKYTIAQRVTLAIVLCVLWDFYKGSTKQDIIDFYDLYMAYHKSFNEGKEDIYKQMVAIDEMLDGKLMKENYFEYVKRQAMIDCGMEDKDENEEGCDVGSDQ